MSEPIEIILVTGYLGAGKTTLLNHLLQLPSVAARQPALVVNEFGQQGIDGRLIDAADRPLYEINRGSLFCICTQTELLAALEDLAVRVRPGVVLVEATGVAETADLEELLERPTLAGRFRMRANLCVVDAVGFTKVAGYLRSAGSQVAAADVLVLNKTDLARPEELAAVAGALRAINPRAPQTAVAFATIDEALLDGIVHRRCHDALAQARPDAVYAASFQSETPVDRQRFQAALAALGEKLLRLKGNVHFAGEAGPQYVESVAGRWLTGPPVCGVGNTAFTVIAYDVVNGRLEELFRQALDPSAG